MLVHSLNHGTLSTRRAAPIRVASRRVRPRSTLSTLDVDEAEPGDERSRPAWTGRLGDKHRSRSSSIARDLSWRHFGGSVMLVVLALGIALPLRPIAGIADVCLFFLIAVLASAIRFGLLPSLLACVLSVLAYNFFFLPPLYSLSIASPSNAISLIVFGVVAAAGSNISARMREQTIASQRRSRTMEGLYRFSRELAGSMSRDDVVRTTARQVSSTLVARITLLLPEPGGLAVVASSPQEQDPAAVDIVSATSCLLAGRPLRAETSNLGDGPSLFVPMIAGQGAVGVIGVARDGSGPLLTADEERLLNSLASQAAIAIERVNLARDSHQARLLSEIDRLRTALLASVSHDLRTPLASILGCATSLSTQYDALEVDERALMFRTIREESERLNRFIGNLLDMTRLEVGALPLAGSLADLSDVVGAVLRRASNILSSHRVEVALQRDLPMLNIDVVLFEQVLFNLLDNAVKFSHPGSMISIQGTCIGGDEVVVRLVDEGDGIPASEIESIFQKFYRGRGGMRRYAGTGLGLAICRGFVEAMGGTIKASNRTDKSGAVFTIVLPVPIQLLIDDDDRG